MALAVSMQGPDQFVVDWARLEQQARAESIFSGGYNKPLLGIIEATALTPLRQFHPFTSLNRLCFARSRFPFEDIQPALIEFYPDGRYVVRSGGPYPTSRTPPVELETTDPRGAVSATVRLLGLGE